AQEAACRYDVGAPNTAVSADGGTVAVPVQAGASCEWAAVSQVEWISVTAGSSGTGNGTVTLTVGRNTGAARSGTILVAGRTVAIAQAQAPTPVPPAPSCDASITPSSQTIPSDGGTGAVSVTIADGCAWTASSSANWI